MQSPAINQAMDILKLLRQVTEGQDEAPVKLAKIIKIIAEKMNADAAACYVAVDDSYLELFASYGFNADVAHKVTIRYGEGLVGEIARTSRSLAVADAWGHPKFSYKPELGEENYKSFLGVPLVRWSRSIGVLSLQNREIHEYSRLEIEILETVAMVLSEMIVSEEMTEYKKSLIKARGLASRERVKGLSLSKGYGIGKSLFDAEKVDYCKDMMKKAEEKGVKLLLPIDTVVAADFPNPIDAPVDVETVDVTAIPADKEGLDIGEKTRALFADAIKNAKTVVWNGPMGVFENPTLAAGTLAVAKAMAESDATTVIGGGDSAAACEQLGFADKITHISTGGGASLEFLEGLELPGIACLQDK